MARGASVPQVPFTPLHDIDVRNALLLLEGRRQIDARERRALLRQLEEDIEAHRLSVVAVDLFEVFRRPRVLSDAHAARLLCRSLDILHVAAALEIGCTRFVSGGDRQLALARAAGIVPVDVKRSRGR